MFDRKIFYPFVIIGVDAARSNDIKIKNTINSTNVKAYLKLFFSLCPHIYQEITTAPGLPLVLPVPQYVGAGCPAPYLVPSKQRTSVLTIGFNASLPVVTPLIVC